MGVKRSRTHIDRSLWKDPPAHHCGGCLREGSHQRCTRARDQHNEEQGTPALYTNSRSAREPRNQQKSKEPLNTNGGGGASQAPGAPHRGPLRPMVTRDVLAFFKIPQKVLILAFLENVLQRSKLEKLYFKTSNACALLVPDLSTANNGAAIATPTCRLFSAFG